MPLPSGYTAIPYLESTGTQYIDTGLLQSATTSVTIDAEFTDSSNIMQTLFGVLENSNKFSYYFSRDDYSNQLEYQFVLNTGWQYAASSSAPYVPGRHIWATEYANNTLTCLIDGNSIGTFAPNGPVQNSTYHALLFAANSDTSGAIYKAKARIYEVTIQNAGYVFRHMVPAMRNSDSVLGLYDLAQGSFYTNRGTGQFIALGVDPPASITVSDSIQVGDSVSIAWAASPSDGVTGYILERSVNGGSWTVLSTSLSYFYTDTAENGWTSVQYRVSATDGENTSAPASSPLRQVTDPFAPTSPNFSQEYQMYLAALSKPFKKVVRLEFLQPDDTVAFALGGRGQKIPIAGRDTRTFLQSGSVSVNLANGARRRASVMLGNRDMAFDYAVNKLWFGQRVRISMGMTLPNGEDFYFPMGIFYIENPSVLFSPSEKTATLNLTDKWAYLDGSLFGTLEAAYSVNAGTNIFSAIDSFLLMSKYTYSAASTRSEMIDPVDAVYTTYFSGKTYSASKSDGSIVSDIAMTSTPYVITENRGSTMAAVILKLNEMLAGWIGYDAAGALRLEPSQDDIDDADKPVLYEFSPEDPVLISMTESAQVSSVYNDVTVAGQGLTNQAVWARAVNDDPASDTNINLIGRKVLTEEKADYWNTDQCAALARFYLKRKSVLQKSISIECGQMFHLVENRLISVKRTDKPGSPVEKHLIQGFTVPIGETGSMSIQAVSVNDIPDFTITTSYSS